MANNLENSVGIVETKTLRVIQADTPLKLQCGKTLGPIDVAYETYGTLNEKGDNAIYICHALTGNAHVAGYNSPEDKKPGWWEEFVGPGKIVDTNIYHIVCSNFLGGCSGTTGPCDINPETGRPYGLDFPVYTISDMVKVQKLLLDKLGIEHLVAVIGGSMGGMHTLQWTIDYPDFMDSAIAVATTTRLSAQAIAFDAVGRNAILADEQFKGGQYHEGQGPDRGLCIARMIGHITYLSEKGMRGKFGRTLRATDDYSYNFDPEFSIETYLNYQGRAFVERFDANCYLYVTKAMDYFDLAKDYGSLAKAFEKTKARFLVVSFSSDWLFPPEQSEDLVDALVADGKDVSYCNIESPYGHDAFLLEPETLGATIKGFLDSTYKNSDLANSTKSDSAQTGETEKTKSKLADQTKRIRVDYDLIDSLIEPQSHVLDIGCGDGDLLLSLMNSKKIKGEGIELDQKQITRCISRKLPVVQRDIERGLEHYADNSFDYVLLSQTLQTLKDPEAVFNELLRVGKKVVVSFPNFAYWRSRVQLIFQGKSPKTSQMPFSWHDSPNIHFLSLNDFEEFCDKLGVTIEKKIPLRRTKASGIKFIPNLLAEQAIYVTSKS